MMCFFKTPKMIKYSIYFTIIIAVLMPIFARETIANPDSMTNSSNEVVGTNLLSPEEATVKQIGIVVEDLDATVKNLSVLGFGPFVRVTADHPAAKKYGERVAYQVNLAFADINGMQLELIEYAGGDTVHKDFLDAKGEGLHHFAFNVKNLDHTIKQFGGKGIDVIQEDRFMGGGGIAYLSPEKTGGIIFELVQLPEKIDPEGKAFLYRSEW